MSKKIIFLALVLFSCSHSDNDEIFKIDSYSNYEIIDFDKINNIESFNTAFWKADSANAKFSFVAKYDFEKADFTNNSIYGIKIEGLPYNCLLHDCSNRSSLRFYYSSNFDLLDEELNILTDKEIVSLISENIFNNGKNPALSESPETAIIELFLAPNQNINKLAPSLKVISDCYSVIIKSQISKTGFTTKSVLAKYPLKILLRSKMFAHNLTPTIESEKIEAQIEDDFKD